MGLIEEYTPPTAPDRYADAIAEVVEAIEAGNPNAAYAITVDTSDAKAGTKTRNGEEVAVTAEEVAEALVESEKVAFQTAARNAGYSARERERSAEGKVIELIFTLGDKITRTRKPKDEDSTSAPVSGSVVTEATA